MFNDVCFHIIINIKHAEKISNLRKDLKNCVHESEFTISDYEI